MLCTYKGQEAIEILKNSVGTDKFYNCKIKDKKEFFIACILLEYDKGFFIQNESEGFTGSFKFNKNDIIEIQEILSCVSSVEF